MKRQCLIVLATVAAMIIGLGSLASVQGSDIVLAIPGFTIVQDAKDDLLLRNCDPAHPGIACSLYPGASPDLPGYFDIKNAKIIQHGPKDVDLFIALYAPIPAVPQYPYGFVNYFWQFEGGCVTPPNIEKKSGISIVWNVNIGEWRANWYVIKQCKPRVIAPGDQITSFEFTADGVKVRVALDDLMQALDPDGKLTWQAGVRWVPFIYPNNCVEPYCWSTVAVDYAPDVVELVPAPEYIDYPEKPATWEPR